MTFDPVAKWDRAVVAPEAMAQADARTIAAGTPQFMLVDRAARACLRVLRAGYPRQAVSVLCGPGMNGEDGLALAQMLIELSWPVEVLRLNNEAPLDEARYPLLVPHLRPTGVFAPSARSLVIDALFGAGLSRPLDGEAAALIARINEADARVFAIDLPSGVDGASGVVLGCAPRAETTVTFHRLKPGHLMGEGAELCGAVHLADLGILHEEADTTALWNHPRLWSHLLAPAQREVHKYARGGVAVIGGPGLKGGAARLAARAASMAGAGAVTFLSPVSAAEYAASQFDAVMVRRIQTSQDLHVALSQKMRAVVVGPGMGHGDASAERLHTALGSGLPAVVDADALTLYTDAPDTLFQALHEGCVLTPHEGEFARLFPDITGSKLDRARLAAERSGATVLLKGATTVIAAPGEVPVISTQGSPALATAGSGDCLAGVIGALLAQGLSPYAAASIGAWVHGEAGRTAPMSLNADALPARIAEVLGGLL
ncbi:MAG: NAD(P)H-hydrate dehydratase [Pseudomonadota bacterium]